MGLVQVGSDRSDPGTAVLANMALQPLASREGAMIVIRVRFSLIIRVQCQIGFVVRVNGRFQASHVNIAEFFPDFGKRPTEDHNSCTNIASTDESTGTAG